MSSSRTATNSGALALGGQPVPGGCDDRVFIDAEAGMRHVTEHVLRVLVTDRRELVPVDEVRPAIVTAIEQLFCLRLDTQGSAIDGTARKTGRLRQNQRCACSRPAAATINVRVLFKSRSSRSTFYIQF